MKILYLSWTKPREPNDFHALLLPGNCWILSKGVHNMEKAILSCWLVLEEVESPWYVFWPKTKLCYLLYQFCNWHRLVTCYFDDWKHQGGVLSDQAICRTMTAITHSEPQGCNMYKVSHNLLQKGKPFVFIKTKSSVCMQNVTVCLNFST